MPKKKVLIVVNYFYPYVSGVSEYCRAVAKTFAKKHDVTVLTVKHHFNLLENETFENYNIIRAKPFLFLNKGYISFDFFLKYKKLSKSSDVINLHLPMLESGFLSCISSRPLLITYQCDMAIVGSIIDRIAVLAVRLSMQLALKRAKFIAVLSKDYARFSPILARFKSKLIEISPPNRFYSEKISVKKKHQKNNLICGFVGRFVLEKGISKIIEAAHLLNNQPVEFWLAGDYKEVAGGSIYSDIKKDIDLLGTKVRLLGRLTENELKNFYRTIDVLLLPSTNRFEAFGMVQMEAMTFGAIVVTSNMPGVRETVRKTGIGQLCTPNSGQSLADAIMRAAKDRLHFTRSDVSSAVRFSFTNKNFEEAYMNLLYQITFDR